MDGPQGARMASPTTEREGLVVAPHPCPTALVVKRRPGGGTTSSSSAARADEPRTPFGLGERRLGEPEPAELEPVASALGLAIGAMGRATGPGSGTDKRLLAGGAMTPEDDAPIGVFGGGPIGAAGASPRAKPGSNAGPVPKFLGNGDGPSGGGGTCCIEGEGPKPNGAGVKGTREGIAAGRIPGPGPYIGGTGGGI